MAEVKVTKNPASTPENVIFDFEIPGGEKGDPGGIAFSTAINANSNLDDYKTPGVYGLIAVTNIQNMPPTTIAGTLMVINRATTAILYQEYVPISSGAGQLFFRRVLGPSGAWSPWRTYSSTRTDQTAGRAIYQWDELNNREQLIYGDTGLRDISALIAGGSGQLYIRRNGSTVTLHGIAVVAGAPVTGICPIVPASSIPGMYPPVDVRQIAATFAGATLIVTAATNGIISLAAASTPAGISFTMSWQTNSVWPTVLPGTASGTIPNL